MATVSLLPTHWYYNTESGQLTQGNNLENLGNNLFGGLGWHELDISGSATGAQAAAAAKAEFPAGKAPSYAPPNLGTYASTAAGEAGIPAADLSGLASIGAFFSTLTEAHTWERLGEVVLGLLLIAVGVAHMTRVIPAATAIASKVA